MSCGAISGQSAAKDAPAVNEVAKNAITTRFFIATPPATDLVF
jgi:hypothetical protein